MATENVEKHRNHPVSSIVIASVSEAIQKPQMWIASSALKPPRNDRKSTWVHYNEKHSFENELNDPVFINTNSALGWKNQK